MHYKQYGYKILLNFLVIVFQFWDKDRIIFLNQQKGKEVMVKIKKIHFKLCFLDSDVATFVFVIATMDGNSRKSLCFFAE